MSRSIFAKNLPNGGLGTAPATKPQVPVVIAENITPTLQRLTYTSVDADSVDIPTNPDAGQQVNDVDLFKAPNPILADVEPASSEFGKGEVLAPEWPVPGDGGMPFVMADGKIMTTPAVFTDPAGKLTGSK
jgi:hypothetical protein